MNDAVKIEVGLDISPTIQSDIDRFVSSFSGSLKKALVPATAAILDSAAIKASSGSIQRAIAPVAAQVLQQSPFTAWRNATSSAAYLGTGFASPAASLGIGGAIGQSLGFIGGSFGSVFASVGRAMTSWIAGLFAVAAALRTMHLVVEKGVKVGIRYNQGVEDSTLSIARMLRTSDPDRFNTFAKAMEGSKTVVAGLKKEEEKGIAAFADLAQATQSLMLPLMSAGISLSKAPEVIGMMSRALSVVRPGFSGTELANEGRALLGTGARNPSTLLRSLLITPEEIKQHKEAGTLLVFLTEKLGKFSEAAGSADRTLTRLTFEFGNVWEELMGQLTETLFTSLKEIFEKLIKYLKSDELQTTIREVKATVKPYIEGAGVLSKVPATIWQGVENVFNSGIKPIFQTLASIGNVAGTLTEGILLRSPATWDELKQNITQPWIKAANLPGGVLPENKNALLVADNEKVNGPWRLKLQENMKAFEEMRTTNQTPFAAMRESLDETAKIEKQMLALGPGKFKSAAFQELLGSLIVGRADQLKLRDEMKSAGKGGSELGMEITTSAGWSRGIFGSAMDWKSFMNQINIAQESLDTLKSIDERLSRPLLTEMEGY